MKRLATPVLSALILASGALTAGALAVPAAIAAPAAPHPAIVAAVAHPERPAADVARDVNRLPAETAHFAGVRPGMVIGELNPGGGYYTRILSKAVGPTGKVYAVVSKGQAARPGGLDRINALAASLGNVEVVVQDYTALALPQKADLVWTTENYHDFHNGPTADIAALNKAVHASLKPGGVFFVEDHSAKPGMADATSKVHRMDEEVAKAELTAAGFRLDATSDLLRNPEDKRDGENADQMRGKTDRFMLRMKRS